MLFLGAGASKPFGIPTMAEFTEAILAGIESLPPDEPTGKILKDYVSKIREIQEKAKSWGFNPDIEAILSILQGRADPKKALNDLGPSLTVFTQEYRNMAPDTLASVAVAEIEQIIYRRCSQLDINRAIKLYGELWDYLSQNLTIPLGGGRSNLRQTIHIGQSGLQRIFTTNYDRSVETFLVRRGLSFSDGFQLDGVGDHIFTGNWGGGTNLYKMHGSINYYQREDGRIVRSDAPLGNVDAYGREIKGRMMIYPTGEKYSSRSPFYEYLGQLRQALFAEQVCIVIGYSFRDVPINNAFLDGIQRNTNLVILVVGPTADKVVGRLDKSMSKRITILNEAFGTGDRVPEKIGDAFKMREPVAIT